MEKLNGTKSGRQRAEGSKVTRIKIDGLISKKIAEKVGGSFESIRSICTPMYTNFYYEFGADFGDVHLSCTVIFFLISIQNNPVRTGFTLSCS